MLLICTAYNSLNGLITYQNLGFYPWNLCLILYQCGWAAPMSTDCGGRMRAKSKFHANQNVINSWLMPGNSTFLPPASSSPIPMTIPIPTLRSVIFIMKMIRLRIAVLSYLNIQKVPGWRRCRVPGKWQVLNWRANFSMSSPAVRKITKTPDNLQVGGRIHLAKVKITSKKHKPVYKSVAELSLLQVA